MATSKLFTPAQRHRDDCYVTPFTAPEGPLGFASGSDGGALYPLRLGGNGKASSLKPDEAEARTTNYPGNE